MTDGDALFAGSTVDAGRASSRTRTQTPPPMYGHVRVCESETAFVRQWPAQATPARALWEPVEDGRAVGLVVSPSFARDLTGRDDRTLIARIDRMTGQSPNEGAFLLNAGASARDVFQLIERRDRLAAVRDNARWEGTGDDPDLLAEQVEQMTAQVHTRDALDSAFAEEWVPRVAVDRVLVSAAAVERDPESPTTTTDRTPSHQQTSIHHHS